MFKVLDREKKEVATCSSMSEAKVCMLVHYCTEELPRLSKIMDVGDFKQMMSNDIDTANNLGMIEDYMEIIEG